MISGVIEETGAYIPENKVYNDFFIEHFEQQGVKVEGLMNHLGKRKRYPASENETSLTMAIEAVKDCIGKAVLILKSLICWFLFRICRNIFHLLMHLR